MRVVVIGAAGTIGRSVVSVLEGAGHDVVRASRTGEPRVDLSEPDSIDALFRAVGTVDAVVCCAANAPLTPLTDDGFRSSLNAKLFGQVEVARRAVLALSDGGSITLTSGQIPTATPGSAGGALVNAGLEAFVTAAAVELPRGLRLNATWGWIRRTALPPPTWPAPTYTPWKATRRARRSRQDEARVSSDRTHYLSLSRFSDGRRTLGEVGRSVRWSQPWLESFSWCSNSC
jgi:NAD(P)-dependent dehydrogenase (short-subunit alcohol dehydrogenase family)